MEHLSEETQLSRYSKDILRTTSTLNCCGKLLRLYDNNFTCVNVLQDFSTKIPEVLKEEGFGEFTSMKAWGGPGAHISVLTNWEKVRVD